MPVKRPDRCPYYDRCLYDRDKPCDFTAPPFAWAWCERHMEYEYQDRLAAAMAMAEKRKEAEGDEAIVKGNDAIEG